MLSALSGSASPASPIFLFYRAHKSTLSILTNRITAVQTALCQPELVEVEPVETNSYAPDFRNIASIQLDRILLPIKAQAFSFGNPGNPATGITPHIQSRSMPPGPVLAVAEQPLGRPGNCRESNPQGATPRRSGSCRGSKVQGRRRSV